MLNAGINSVFIQLLSLLLNLIPGKEGKISLEICNKANPILRQIKRGVEVKKKNGNGPWTKGQRKLTYMLLKSNGEGRGWRTEKRMNLIITKRKKCCFIYLGLVLFTVLSRYREQFQQGNNRKEQSLEEAHIEM